MFKLKLESFDGKIFKVDLLITACIIQVVCSGVKQVFDSQCSFCRVSKVFKNLEEIR